jgi:hypothetical protein
VTLVTCRTSTCEEILWRGGDYTIPIELDQRKRSDVVRTYWGIPRGEVSHFIRICGADRHIAADTGSDVLCRLCQYTPCEKNYSCINP